MAEESDDYVVERVRTDEEEGDLVEMLGIAGELHEKEKISSLLPQVNHLFPLHQYHLDHLKRMKFTDEGKMLMFLFPLSEEQPQSLFPNVQVVSVPKNRAYTRAQFEKYKRLWPISFHAQQGIPENLSSLEEQRSVDFFKKNFTSFLHSSSTGRNLAIITENDFSIRAQAVSESEEPLEHACMKAIEAMAEQERHYHNIHLERPLTDNHLHSSAPIKRRAESNNYLCTGKTLFTWKEPCIMCSMALVHSRIERVFFHKANSAAGGLMSKAKIGYLKSLNHHFISYQLKAML